MDNLVEESKKENFATGGYIVFAHYISLEQNFFLVAMVKKKDGITLVDLKPETIQEVDLSKLHQAIKINNGNYVSAMENVTNGEPFEGSYLSFISPSEKGASSYFVSTFGCDDAIPAKKATKSAFQAVKFYFDSVPELQHLKLEAVTAVVELFEERLGNDEEDRVCTLEMINEKVQSVITYNGLKDVESNFMDIANSEDFNVPASFYPNKSAVTEETRIKLEGVGGAWKLNFEKRVFGTSEESDIQYMNDSESDEPVIVIRHLNPKLVAKLEKAIADEPSS